MTLVQHLCSVKKGYWFKQMYVFIMLTANEMLKMYLQCTESLWIKVSVRYVNVNVNDISATTSIFDRHISEVCLRYMSVVY